MNKIDDSKPIKTYKHMDFKYPYTLWSSNWWSSRAFMIASKYVPLEIDLYQSKIVFRTKIDERQYKWSEFTEAILYSNQGSSRRSRYASAKTRFLVLRTKDGARYNLDLSVGWASHSDESPYLPNPEGLLTALRKNLKPVWGYDDRTRLHKKWLDPNLGRVLSAAPIFTALIVLTRPSVAIRLSLAQFIMIWVAAILLTGVIAVASSRNIKHVIKKPDK